MSENRVIRENYITLQGWMITDLELKGTELIIYACIYGFLQAENQVFSGSLQYLADWTNCTKQGVIKCLKSLVEKGYIQKNEKIINGVKFCEYYATKFNRVLNKVEYPMQQSLIGGIKQSLPNNIAIDNIEDNIDDIYSVCGKNKIINNSNSTHAYGRNNNVMLTEQEYAEFKKSRPYDYQQLIDELSDKVAIDTKYKNGHSVWLRIFANAKNKQNEKSEGYGCTFNNDAILQRSRQLNPTKTKRGEV